MGMSVPKSQENAEGFHCAWRLLTLLNNFKKAVGTKGCCVFQYKATDYVVKEPGKLELVFTPMGGKEHRMEVFTFKDRGGVGMSMYNTDEVDIFWNSVFLLFNRLP